MYLIKTLLQLLCLTAMADHKLDHKALIGRYWLRSFRQFKAYKKLSKNWPQNEELFFPLSCNLLYTWEVWPDKNNDLRIRHREESSVNTHTSRIPGLGSASTRRHLSWQQQPAQSQRFQSST